MTEAAGSYAFGEFDENERELTRLKAQAGAAQALERRILQQGGLQPGMRVLDLACGPGVVSCALARMVAPAGWVTGVDLSPDLLAEAKAAAVDQGLDNLSFYQGDVYALDLADASFDFVYARFLFQHLRDPQQALTEAHRVLAPGGRLLVADVDDGWLAMYPTPPTFNAFIERAARTQASQGGNRHVGRQLGELLQGAGFSEVALYVHSLTSDDLGLKPFLDLTTGYKSQLMQGEDQTVVRQELEAIYAFAESQPVRGFTSIFAASGLKS